MKKLITTLLVLGTLGFSGSAYAAPGNPTNVPGHPRVNQVNTRIQNQHNRIQQGEKNGTISKQQAQKLHQERTQIKGEEHAMRKADNGHLTKSDQKALNQQLNKRSKEIHQDKHK